jgi:hypothetical protein
VKRQKIRNQEEGVLTSRLYEEENKSGRRRKGEEEGCIQTTGGGMTSGDRILIGEKDC